MSRNLKIYPESTSKKLGFDTILQETLRFTFTPYGTEYLQALKPTADLNEVKNRLKTASEWMTLFEYGQNTPLETVEDVREMASNSKLEGSRLPLENFPVIYENARLARYILDFFKKLDASEDFSALRGIASNLVSLKPLEEAILNVVNENGELRDDASPELRKIRKKINRERNRLRSTIQQVMKRVAEKGMTSDEGATIRGGRMVIPIQVEYKRKVNGFIHDVSSTGQTVYLEPIEALQINNEIRQLISEEQREIDRIIKKLTSEVRKYSDTLIHNTHYVGEIDAIQCRVQIGMQLNGHIPELSKNTNLEIYDAKNPNLILKNRNARQPEEIVPLNLTLSSEELGLIITGPNAGGKSVAMKTLGILSMMLQSGFPVPVQPHSKMPVLTGLFVDIGDDQSIENDLSTFSSRLNWMRQTLEFDLNNTLILIDEAGSGTDPEEGGALFQAFIEEAIEQNGRVVVTTHHGSLKVFAQQHDQVINGAMEFNQENLSPTYRFKKGIPGSSYAFEIADRLKLQKSLMVKARNLLGDKRNKMSHLLVNLEKKMQESEDLVRNYRIKSTELEKREKQFREKAENLDQKRKQIIEKAYRDAGDIMRDANRKIEQAVEKVVSEGRENKEKIKEARNDVIQAKKEIAEEQKSLKEDINDEPYRSKEAPGLGDFVLVGESNTSGELVELSDNRATILVNGMRIKAKLKDLVKTKKPSGKSKKQTARSYTSAQNVDLSVKPSIELRGKRGEEAIQELTLYLDKAIARGLHQVEIIHGKGEGILKELVHNYLESRDEIKSYNIAPMERGGSGCTIVNIQ